MTNSTPPDNYEENFAHLKQIVERLEREKLGLEESLSLFEEGMKLANLCDHQLLEVEERVRVLVSGNETLTPRADIPLQAVSESTIDERPLEN